MKKCLLLVCLFVTINNVFAFTTQGHWRWRKDDGTETTATWLADTNTTPAFTSNSNIRLRTEIYNSNTTAKDISNTSLAYSLTGADNTWITITDTATTNDFVLATSPFVTALQATTQQLPKRAGYTFMPGVIISSQDAYSYSLPSNDVTEFEFVIKPTANTKLNTTYYFETSVLGYDKPLPTLTIGSVLPISLVSFTVAQQDGKAIVQWTTANEVNNDHFDILRSCDAQSWQMIASVKAAGNGSSIQNNYKFIDNTPLSGNSYYRLKQYDKDGSTTLSDVKNFSLKGIKNLAASIYPNPTSATVNVVLNNYTGSVTATVINAQGTVVHREVIAATAGTAAYKLSLNQKLSAGTYYVNLSGKDLSQKLKVIVQ